MARDFPSHEHPLEEEYIDMDISSTTFICYTITSPPHYREFEFHLSSNSLQKETITSPADELFYKGKLLPLHLPPRLQMVEKILTNSASNTNTSIATTTNPSAYTTPLESCNISPTNSCYVSGELNPEEYYECSAVAIQTLPKKSWSKKLKQSSLGLKLKASRAFFKSLFTKSACSDDSCAVSKAEDTSNCQPKAGKRNPFVQIRRRVEEEDSASAHRRSFSVAINRHPAAKNSTSSSSSSCSSSSSSSFSSASLNESDGQPVLKRSSSVKSEGENPIQVAIAYCKRSHQLVSGRKSLSDVGCCSMSAARIAAACDNKDKPCLCRG